MKILIIKLSAMGDLFHALPAVHNLKEKLDAEIHWVTQKEYADLVQCFSDVDRVIPFYRKSFFSNFNKFLKDLRADKYDYIIDLQGLFKSGMVAALAKGRKRIGPSFYREGARIFYTDVAGKRNKERHAVEENLDIISHLRLDPVKPMFPVSFPKKQLTEKKPRVAILPMSRWETKNWPEEYFTKLAKKLNETKEMSLFLLGGPEDVNVCKEIENALDGNVTNLSGKGTLVDLGSVLSEMDLLIANDSGPVHMAVAAGIPTLVVFGPTDPARTGPYGDNNTVLQENMPCQPCFSRICETADIKCLFDIKPEKVYKKALKALNS